VKTHYRRTNMKYMAGILGGILVAIHFLSEKQEIIVTKRKRRELLPSGVEDFLGEQLALVTLKTYEDSIVDTTHPLARHIEAVGDHLCKANGLPKHRYVLIESPEANAFVLPGRTVFVFTGVLPILANESGCAMVIAHELSHILAHHGIDAILISTPFVWISHRFFGRIGDLFTDIVLSLPRSRTNELEADIIGLHLMANACFDVDEAPKVMDRLTNSNAEVATAWDDWFHTHPSGQKRIDQLLKAKKADAILEMQKACPKSITNAPKYHYLSKFNYQQQLPRISTKHLQELLKSFA